MTAKASDRPKGEVVKPDDVAAICRVSIGTIRKWLKIGRLKISRRPAGPSRRLLRPLVGVMRADLEAFLAANGMPAEWLTDWLAKNAPQTATPTEAAHAA